MSKMNIVQCTHISVTLVKAEILERSVLVSGHTMLLSFCL